MTLQGGWAELGPCSGLLHLRQLDTHTYDGVSYCSRIHVVVSNHLLCRLAKAAHRHGDRALHIAEQDVVCVPSIRVMEDGWESNRHTHYSSITAVHTAVIRYQRSRRPMLMLTVVVAAGSNALRKSAMHGKLHLSSTCIMRSTAQCNAKPTACKNLQSNLAAAACCCWIRAG